MFSGGIYNRETSNMQEVVFHELSFHTKKLLMLP